MLQREILPPKKKQNKTKYVETSWEALGKGERQDLKGNCRTLVSIFLFLR